jgi:hypothetical protein
MQKLICAMYSRDLILERGCGVSGPRKESLQDSFGKARDVELEFPISTPKTEGFKAF